MGNLARRLLTVRHHAEIFPQADESENAMTSTFARNLLAAMASVVIATTCTFAAAGPALLSWTA